MRKQLELKRTTTDNFEGLVKQPNKRYAWFSARLLHKYFDVPEDVKTIWLEVSDKRTKESYSVAEFLYEVYMGGVWFAMNKALRDWTCDYDQRDMFYLRVLY